MRTSRGLTLKALNKAVAFHVFVLLSLMALESSAFQRTFPASIRPFLATSRPGSQEARPRYSQLFAKENTDDGDADDDDLKVYSSEVVEDDEGDDAAEWLPDSEKARKRKEAQRMYVEQQQKPSTEKPPAADGESDADSASPTNRASAYTEEEEDVITAMGGKISGSKREAGFLGDSTLEEISTDYSVPICYIADVLCMWGVAVPINVRDRLGDLATGEQAFALLEAVNSLDIGALNDRYSNQNLLQVCSEWGMELQDAFEMAMKEGWSLPFGVQTCLRVEQEEELLRVLSPGTFASDD